MAAAPPRAGAGSPPGTRGLLVSVVVVGAPKAEAAPVAGAAKSEGAGAGAAVVEGAVVDAAGAGAGAPNSVDPAPARP